MGAAWGEPMVVGALVLALAAAGVAEAQPGSGSNDWVDAGTCELALVRGGGDVTPGCLDAAPLLEERLVRRAQRRLIGAPVLAAMGIAGLVPSLTFLLAGQGDFISPGLITGVALGSVLLAGALVLVVRGMRFLGRARRLHAAAFAFDGTTLGGF